MSTAPFCKDCVHVRHGWFGARPRCDRPTGTIDLVTGKPVRVFRYAHDERSRFYPRPDDCGPTGKFFTSRTSRHEEHRA